MNLITNHVFHWGLLALLGASACHAQGEKRSSTLPLPSCLVFSIHPSQPASTGNARLDSTQRNMDATLTGEFRRAFPALVELLPGGDLHAFDTTAWLWSPESGIQDPRIRTLGLQRPRWHRSAIGDSLIFDFGDGPLFGQIHLLDQPPDFIGNAALRSDIGRWGQRPVTARRVSCSSPSDSTRRPPNER
jgi:hypothetical protein